LNWLAETQFEATSAVFRNLASQGGVPRQLKFAAMLNLGIHQHKEGLPALVASLKENDPLTQAVAIAALGELGEAAAAAEVRPFLSSRNDLIAATSAEAAGMLRDGESVAVLLKFLGDKNHEKRHPLIAKALSKIGTQPAWDGLLATAAGRKFGFQARRSAALSLGKARYGPATPVLTKVLNDDREDKGIRLNTISALALLGSEDAWAAITAVAGGKNQSLARWAVKEMGGSKNPAQIAQVIEIAGKAGHAQRETALDQIRYRKLAGAGPTLRAVIREASVSADLRAVAASALAATSEKLEDEDFSALWMAWERERDPYARERLADALIAGGFGDKTRIPELIDGLDEDKNQSWFANVKLLRHLTGQKLGPENKYSGDKKTRKAEFEKWRAWRAAQRP
jgi:HEAT repeat protein